MTYSNNLDPTVPGQGEFARLGAGRIRDLTKAVKERLASIFVDPDADPLVFKPDTLKILDLKHVVYTFVFVTPASSYPAGSITTVSQASALPAGTPTMLVWSPAAVVSGIANLAHLVIGTPFHDGVNLNFTIKNTSGGTLDLNGSTIKVYSFPLT